ncbi:MAG: SDR family NAD(P)-dependent oxidoreductase [Gemmatimonadetes bacterium]|nr:SDR family NAD(P)-dependent oxidoreductase [Gemmatimonadota bacterium]
MIKPRGAPSAKLNDNRSDEVAQVVVITGASGGIGAALAERLASEGHSVVLVARRADALASVAARCGGRAYPLVADCTRRHEVRRAAAEAVATLGHVDVWVNNVGRGMTRQPSELTGTDIDDMMLVNVKSALYGMQEILPHFKARGRGHVVNISSMLGRIPFAAMRAAYSGAKHFLNSITSNMRTEIQQTHPDIEFSLVSPGVVRTDFGKNAVHGGPDSRELPDSQSAEDVAAVIAGVIRSRKPDVYTREGSQARVGAHYAAIGVDP